MKNNFLFVAGPCAMESGVVQETAAELKCISEKLDIDFVFKVSFDKANRSSADSYRGLGFDKGMEILQEIKTKYNIRILTDVHETWQVEPVATIADIIQIPALLCRQTDLLEAADTTGKIINIKKGQFYAYHDIQYFFAKCKNAYKDNRLYVTERGTFFGYNDLVVDMRGLPVMRKQVPVLFDATHSVQRPSSEHGISGGDRSLIPYLARGAVMVGVDGLYMEVHPCPEKALSDGAVQFPLSKVENFWREILEVRALQVKLDSRP